MLCTVRYMGSMLNKTEHLFSWIDPCISQLGLISSVMPLTPPKSCALQIHTFWEAGEGTREKEKENRVIFFKKDDCRQVVFIYK